MPAYEIPPATPVDGYFSWEVDDFDYRAEYYRLYGEVASAIEEMQAGRHGQALSRLVQAQLGAEERYADGSTKPGIAFPKSKKPSDLILDIGLSQASMAKISKEAKIPIGSIYHFYPSKEALVNEVYLHSREKFMGASLYSAYDAQLDFEGNFKVFVKRYIQNALENAKDYMFITQYHLSPVIESANISNPDITIGNMTLLRAMKLGIVKQNPPYLVSSMIIGMINECVSGHITGAFTLEDSSVDAIATACWDAVKE